MLFGLGKKKGPEQDNRSNLARSLVEHLNKVDEEYMKSFAVKSVRGLQDYVSRECAVKISQSVFAIGTRYFGADKFRTTTWTLFKEDGSILTIQKVVTFDKVRVGGAMSINVADSYRELWTVNVERRGHPIVQDIMTVK